MDLWGQCPGCHQWFYCDYLADEWVCPVCGREPVSIENRAPGRTESVEASR
jgi:rRNA maturation endonuclease Nob1